MLLGKVALMLEQKQLVRYFLNLRAPTAGKHGA